MMCNVKKYTNLVLGIMLFGALTGCADRVSLAEAEMANIRSQPAKPIEPPPTPKVIEDYEYAASNVRNPFVPQSLIDAQNEVAKQPKVRPDETRTKHPLENFEISQLTYLGNMSKSPKSYDEALIQAPDGIIRRVRVGDYIGKNHGRITEIDSTDIYYIEIVEDVKFGYVEKADKLSAPN